MNERAEHRANFIARGAAATFAALVSYAAIAASPPTPTPPPSGVETYRTECGACHIAYPPALLPAGSWRAMLRKLDDHFGVDATLDASSSRAIAAYLEAAAGRERRATDAASAPALRITETAWFRHEHEELPTSIWRRKSVGSPANCAACHTDAAQGRFSEHTVRIPK